jgi:hypothetical protein
LSLPVNSEAGLKNIHWKTIILLVSLPEMLLSEFIKKAARLDVRAARVINHQSFCIALSHTS